MFYTTDDAGLFELDTNVLPAAMGYRAKCIRCGDMIEVEICPYWNTKPKGIRSKRIGKTKPKNQKQNEKNSRKMFTRYVQCNFGKKDYHLVVSYEIAPSEVEARRDIKNLIRRIQTARVKAGLKPGKYMFVIEFSEDKQKRIHCHLILEGGLDRDTIEDLWKKGRTNCRRLQPDEFGLAGLATYLMKDPKGKKRWGASRGLKKPKVTYRQITRRRAESIAANENAAPELFEKEYKGYKFLDMQPPKWSEYVSGVYVYARMRRIA